ncbi:transcription factor with AP2 domain(s), putative [Plasmodium vinckei lentum]|uniref:Transcription factor with AP2 domain(S), putative n=1 Tax=Plasmodium vinckei lentum TaxID=138297 RepID=A0A6V7SU63_PLAVN|nr:transcription factor with AP2 domain(s), putative [Plasmodium vinckei lentum]
MNCLHENELPYTKNKKKIEKCYKVWEKIISKGIGCRKEEIKNNITKRKRDKERLISTLYGSVFKGEKYLLYSKKWRGKTLNEIINQDKKNYLNLKNLKNLKNVDNSYFCKLAIGYLDQENNSSLKKKTNSECAQNYDQDMDNKNMNASLKKNQAINNNNSGLINKKKNQSIEKNTEIHNNEDVYEKLNYLEKRSYRNKIKANSNYNCNTINNNLTPNDTDVTNSKTNNHDNALLNSNNNINNDHINNRDNHISIHNIIHNNNEIKNSNIGCNTNNNKEAYNNDNNNYYYSNFDTNKNYNNSQAQNDNKCYEKNNNDNRLIKYKYLPTGVFYSRVSRSFIANWIDDKTKKQIKMPYKISEFGVEKCMILAILSRNLRISNINSCLKYYDKLTEDQKEQMLQAIRTTQKSEKLFNDILKPNIKNITNSINDMCSASTSNSNKNNENETKSLNVKNKVIEKKKVKQSYNNAEKLPTGVYFYQGSYVANWWETNQKKQFKVPFKISEYGMTRAKNLAIISRLIRSSSIQEVNLILTQMEQNKNITKLNYTTILNLAFKYMKNPPKKY